MILLVLLGKDKTDVDILAVVVFLICIDVALIELIDMGNEFFDSGIVYILFLVLTVLIEDVEYHGYLVFIVVARYLIVVAVLLYISIEFFCAAVTASEGGAYYA